jgi:hypothetical protein
VLDWPKSFLFFAVSWVGLRFVIRVAYTHALQRALCWYIFWRMRAPSRKRGTARFRELSDRYEATGDLHPELKDVFDEMDEYG